MKIAVIGGGIFGVTTALILSANHSVELFEKNSDILKLLQVLINIVYIEDIIIQEARIL